MADRPIIFSAPMVRALLAGRKAQTRRAIKPPTKMPTDADIVLSGTAWSWRLGTRGGSIPTPYAPGDRLWVREAIDRASVPGDVHYRADYEGDPTGLGWTPSIHMPRWASRLTLTITDVRVQRLQDISEEDARGEGCALTDAGVWNADPTRPQMAGCDARGAFYCLWNSIHGPDAWDANPWVAAIGFIVHRQNIDAAVAP